jgi:hypothetical protein
MEAPMLNEVERDPQLSVFLDDEFTQEALRWFNRGLAR